MNRRIRMTVAAGLFGALMGTATWLAQHAHASDHSPVTWPSAPSAPSMELPATPPDGTSDPFEIPAEESGPTTFFAPGTVAAPMLGTMDG